MATRLAPNYPTLIIRRAAFERFGLSRAAFDERLGLTDEEFRVDGRLVLVGPIVAAADMQRLIGDLEASGLAYFDDFFEVSGNWPEWLALVASDAEP